MVSTSKINETTVGIPQKGMYWCVPASIENLLRTEGINDITQEDIIYEYLVLHFGNHSVDHPTKGISLLKDIDKNEMMNIFRQLPLQDISFQKLTSIVNNLIVSRGYNKSVTFIDGIKNNDEYVSHIKNTLIKDKAVLISASNNNGGWHIIITHQIDDEYLWSYDPASSQHIKVKISDYTFSHDILFIT